MQHRPQTTRSQPSSAARHTRPAGVLTLWIALGLALWPACSDSSSGQPGAGTCPAGQAPRYSPQTGAFLGCFVADDGGSLDDALAQDTAAGSDLGSAEDSSQTDGSTQDAGQTDAAIADAEDSASSTCPANLTALERWWQCPPERTAGSGLHGEACTSDADCWYGHCLFGSPFAGYDPAIGICTKNCGFGGPGTGVTECVKDDGNGVVFTCNFEKTKQSGNDKIAADQPDVFKACLRSCKADADCVAWNPALPNCAKSSDKYLSLNPNGVCVKQIPQ